MKQDQCHEVMGNINPSRKLRSKHQKEREVRKWMKRKEKKKRWRRRIMLRDSWCYSWFLFLVMSAQYGSQIARATLILASEDVV